MLAAAVFGLLLLYTFLFYRKVSRYPKGPLPLPIIGNLHQIRLHDLHKYLHTLGKKYGHCYTLFLPYPIVVFTDYAHIKGALVDNGEHFIARSQRPPETLLQRHLQTGVLGSDGEVWREQRRASLRIFREFGMGKSLMEEQVNRSIAETMELVKSTVHGQAVNPSMFIQLCVGNVINETLFGYHFKYGDCGVFEEFVKRVNAFLIMTRANKYAALIGGWPWLKYIPIIRRLGHDVIVDNSSKYIDFIESEVDKAAASFDADMEPVNFVHAYMKEMKKNPALDMKNLYALAADFWLAGMETTSTTLRTALLWLMAYPDVQDRMRSELLSAVGSDRIVTMADKPSMPYFTAAIAEIQRCTNMVPFIGSHKCTRDSVVCGKTIPSGAVTMPQIYSVLEEDSAFDRPNDFRPERFLLDDGTTPNKAAVDRLIAFGMGKRQCAGEGLARMELFLVLAALVQAYRFVPDSVEAARAVLDNRLFGAVIAPPPYECRLVPV